MGRRVGIALAVALVALAGCSSSEGSGAAPAVAQMTPYAGDNNKAGGQTKAPQTQQNAATEPVAQNRQLVRTATMSLSAPNPGEALAKAKDVVLAQGGLVGEENVNSSQATATLRVPGDRLDAAMKAIGELPDVKTGERTVRTEDVTDQVVDVEARLANQRASVERVRGLLDRATTTSEITQIESELTKRQSELESLQRRYDSLRGQVAMSTLTLTVRQQGAPVGQKEEENFLTALGGGWNAMVSAVQWLLIVIGRVLPFVVLLGTPLIGYLAWRRRRKSAVTP